MERKILKKMFHSIAIVGTITLSMFSCSDENIVENHEIGDKGVTVSFKVTSSQEEMLKQQQSMPATRAVIADRLQEQGLTLEDLKTRKLEVQGGGIDACLIETTVEGINPVQPTLGTRANIKTNIDANFSSLGYRSDISGFAPDTPEWFYNAPTQPNGTLVTPRPWAWIKPFARFYAVYPEAKTENKITLSPATYSGTPYVEFEVEKDVKKQKDLMTACSGEVKYETRGVAPETNLKFRHALTAVKFAVGQNLSWNKRITKVEIKNAYSKGKFILPSELDGTGPNTGWETSSLSTRQDFTLDLSSSPVNTNSNPNTVLTGNSNDNYTFYMIPQQLAGVTVVITLESTHAGSTAPNTISVPLQGSWKPGTTKTYKLSQNVSDWTYTLTVTDPPAALYDQTTTYNYGITSFRQAPDGTQQPLAWKVVKYQESTDGGLTWSAERDTKPTWLTALSKENGNGGSSAELGTGSLTKDITDRLIAYNKVLKDATPKGNAGNYWNLSNANGGNDIENTANCYLISAPGHYRIPLVYGNARTNNADYPHSYISNAPVTPGVLAGTGATVPDVVLHVFKDHKNLDITSPYINVQNAASPAKKASVVWSDQNNLIKPGSLSVTGNGANSFVQFEVTKDDIRSGNAVIAVKDNNNVIMWSWHLWFERPEVMNLISITNSKNKNFRITTRNLGYAFLKDEASTYNKPRIVKIKIQQANSNQYSYITITQNPGETKKERNTFYQWGRKDPSPGDDVTSKTLPVVSTPQTIGTVIQNPGTIYAVWSGQFDPYNTTYANTWSIESTDLNATGYPYGITRVYKTIYDPSPAGFHVPTSETFTGFAKTAANHFVFKNLINAEGDWDKGWHFHTTSSPTSPTVFFPASGESAMGYIQQIDENGQYWFAESMTSQTGSSTRFNSGILYLYNSNENAIRAHGHSIRPVVDE